MRSGSVLIAVFLAVASSAPLAARDPSPIKVMVSAMVREHPDNTFVEVDAAPNETVKDIERALRKSSDLLLTKRKTGEQDPKVLILLGVKASRITTGSEIRPDLPALATELVCVIDTQDAVMFVGADHRDPYERTFRATTHDCTSAAEVVAKDLIAWIDANRARLVVAK